MTNQIYRISPTYQDARIQFMGAAKNAGHAAAPHIHSDRKGPYGEDLAIDVVEIIPPGAANLLLVSSGMHGIEGYAGSVVQTEALKQGLFSNLSEDTGVVLIHALNPWGMANYSRTNEDNIDQNRNFLLAFDPLPPEHPGTALAHQAFVMDTANDELRAKFEREFPGQMQAALSRGQHTNPHGLFYGGTKPSWSNRTFREILARYTEGGYRNIAHIDIHTGLGPRGFGEIISNNLPTLPEFQKAQKIWGTDVIKSTVTGTSVSSFLRGTVGEALLGKGIMSITIEFGTLPLMDVMGALIVANRSYTDGFKDQALRTQAITQMKAAFCPDDPAWLSSVIGQNFDEFRKVIAGFDKLGPTNESDGSKPAPSLT